MKAKEQLKPCQIFHFAGHGVSDPADPSKSCLMFQIYKENGASLIQGLFSVEDISRMHLPWAELAKLSACSTAENSTVLLADEVIHIVSGFQVTGFPSVIGSMWPSADQIYIEVARLFYQNLREEGESVIVNGTVAKAIHSAIINIRHTWWMGPLLWAQYIHFGAYIRTQGSLKS
jgi:CHAT domain-containing protein